MNITLDYAETIKNMTADVLFDNFDDFCQMSEDLPELFTPTRKLNETPDLNINLTDIFSKLVYDKSNFTTATKDSPKYTQTDSKTHYTNKLCFSDLFSNKEDDSQKHTQTKINADYYNNAQLEKSDVKRNFVHRLKLENLDESVDYDFTSPTDNSDRNHQYNKYNFSSRNKRICTEFSIIKRKSPRDIPNTERCYSRGITPRADMKNNSESLVINKFLRLATDIDRVDQSQEKGTNYLNLSRSSNFTRKLELAKQSLPSMSSQCATVNPMKSVTKLRTSSPKLEPILNMEPVLKKSNFFKKSSENFGNKIKIRPLSKMFSKLDNTKNQLGDAYINFDIKNENYYLLKKKMPKPAYTKNLANNEIKTSRPKKDFISLPALRYYHSGQSDILKNLQNMTKKIIQK